MTLVECQHVENSVAFGEDDDRSVREPDLEARITS
jgi:hypothetical protein